VVPAREVSDVLVKQHQENWPGEGAREQEVLRERGLPDRGQPSNGPGWCEGFVSPFRT
jgi:hypothetical protein